MNIHNYEGRLKNSVASLKNDVGISAKNKETILAYYRHLTISGLSKPRILKYIDTARRVSGWFGHKDFRRWTRSDVLDYAGKVQDMERTEWTKQWYRVFIRRFMQWIKGHKGDKFPKIVEGIKVHFPKHLKKLPNEGELLTQEDVEKIINACRNSRDRALVSTLYESGCRIGEVGGLRIKHVRFDKYGAVLSVHGKTGARNVRVISSTPHLAAWFSDHPLKDDADAPLWITLGNNKRLGQVNYARLRKILIALSQKAGIKKKCNPHSFRHARATHLANHLTEFQMNQYFGWIQGSNMPATYVHLSGKNTDQALLKLHGIEVDEKDKQPTTKPVKCPRCKTINANKASFCVSCAAVLDQVMAAQLDEKQKTFAKGRSDSDKLMNTLLQDPEVLEILKKKIGEIG